MSDTSSQQNLDALFEELQALQANKKLPPVHLWKPDHEGEIDIRIDAQGRWFHEGGQITRQPLVALFATILRYEAGQYYLVTPVEKLLIHVEDAPFMAIDLDIRGENQTAELLFTTNVGDFVTASSEHSIEMQEDKPYVTVRDGLQARLSRNIYYRLVEFALEQRPANEVSEDEGALYVYSQGARFNLGQLA